MTGLLAARFDRVIAVDVSPEMLERARRAVADDNVDFRAVDGERLDSVEDAVCETLFATSCSSTSPSAGS